MMLFGQIPNDVLIHHILSKLDGVDIISIAETSSVFKNIARNNELWAELCKTDFGVTINKQDAMKKYIALYLYKRGTQALNQQAISRANTYFELAKKQLNTFNDPQDSAWRSYYLAVSTTNLDNYDLKLLKQASDLNNANAAFAYAEYLAYANHKRINNQNPEEALSHLKEMLRYLRLAAEQNHPEALLALAIFYGGDYGKRIFSNDVVIDGIEAKEKFNNSPLYFCMVLAHDTYSTNPDLVKQLDIYDEAMQGRYRDQANRYYSKALSFGRLEGIYGAAASELRNEVDDPASEIEWRNKKASWIIAELEKQVEKTHDPILCLMLYGYRSGERKMHLPFEHPKANIIDLEKALHWKSNLLEYAKEACKRGEKDFLFHFTKGLYNINPQATIELLKKYADVDIEPAAELAKLYIAGDPSINM